MPPTYVIVGASLAGATASIALREESADGRIVLVGEERHAPYERPPLSKAFLRGETPREKLQVRSPSFYEQHGIETMIGVRATRLDAAARTVHLETGDPIGFDALLVATGARNRRLTIPGGNLPGVYTLRTIDEAERIRAEIAPGRTVVVIGLGFIGSEVAASLRAMGLNVIAVEPARAPLERVLGADVGAAVASLHRARGGRLIFEDAVARLEGDERVRSAVTASGQRIDCDFVVAGIGVEPAVEFLAGSAIHIDNGVVVNEYCETNVEGVFAAGDVANHYHPVFGTRMRVEHYQNAARQGVAAARNMLGRGVPYDDIHWFWSDQYDTNIQYAGFHRTWERLAVRGDIASGAFLACYMNDGRVDAAVAFNRGKDLRAVMRLIKSRAQVPAASIEDERVELRSLA